MHNMFFGLGLTIGSVSSSASTLFRPSDLSSDLLRWYKFSDLASMTLSGANILTLNDKSTNAAHLTAVNNPQLVSNQYATFNGTTQLFQNSSPVMWNNGNCEVHIVMQSNGASGSYAVAEGSAASNNQAYGPIVSHFSNLTDDVHSFIRNDANGTVLANTLPLGGTVFDDTKKLVSIIDTGIEMMSLINGVAGSSPRTYTRAGNTLTLNRFSLGGLQRAAASGWFNGRIYECIITKFLTDEQRNNLFQYIATEHGL